MDWEIHTVDEKPMADYCHTLTIHNSPPNISL
jgi:hypothetical protein